MGKESGGSHTIMPKKLAQALMDAGMKHFDSGGPVGDASINDGGFFQNAFGQGIQNFTSGQFLRDFTGQNSFQAGMPTMISQNALPQQAQDVYGQQQNLAQQLLAQSQGQGPSPAQNQLNQTTGQNVSNQAALMASQRGASANPALAARQAARMGAGVQQEAAGQGATLRAQEQLGAQQLLSGQNQGMYNSLQGAIAAQNTADVQRQMGTNQINANIAGQNAQQRGNIFGGLMSGASSVLGGGGLFAKGGEVKGYADGGIANYASPSIGLPSLEPYQGFKSAKIELGKKKDSGDGEPTTDPSAANEVESGPSGFGEMAGGAGDAGGITEGAGSLALLAAHGGTIPGYSDGGILGSVMKLAPLALMALKEGGHVPGKAQVKGDSEKNDVVPAMLSPGEVVIDRETLSAKGEVGNAARLVAKHIEGRNKSEKHSLKANEFLKHITPQRKGYGGILQARKGKC